MISELSSSLLGIGIIANSISLWYLAGKMKAIDDFSCNSALRFIELHKTKFKKITELELKTLAIQELLNLLKKEESEKNETTSN